MGNGPRRFMSVEGSSRRRQRRSGMRDLQ